MSPFRRNDWARGYDSQDIFPFGIDDIEHAPAHGQADDGLANLPGLFGDLDNTQKRIKEDLAGGYEINTVFSFVSPFFLVIPLELNALQRESCHLHIITPAYIQRQYAH